MFFKTGFDFIWIGNKNSYILMYCLFNVLSLNKVGISAYTIVTYTVYEIILDYVETLIIVIVYILFYDQFELEQYKFIDNFFFCIINYNVFHNNCFDFRHSI